MNFISALQQKMTVFLAIGGILVLSACDGPGATNPAAAAAAAEAAAKEAKEKPAAEGSPAATTPATEPGATATPAAESTAAAPANLGSCYVSAKLDGRAWSLSNLEVTKMGSYFAVRYTTGKEDEDVTAAGAIAFLINVPDFKGPGTYSSKDAKRTTFILAPEKGGKKYISGFEDTPATFVVEEFNDNILKGKFSGKLKSPEGNTIEVTDGQIQVKHGEGGCQIQAVNY